jgi:O-antigen/teichoic acid export membrane protein
MSGARWTALGRVVVEIATFAAAIVLARLIDPAGFGHAAVALISVSLAAVLGTVGVVSPLVQRRDLLRQHIASATFLVLAAGVVMTCATAGLAFLVGQALFGERTSDLLALASLAWILVAVGATSQAILHRDLRFRQVAGIEATSAVVGVVVSLTSAIAGIEGGALVLGGLALVATTSVLSLAASPPPFPVPSRAGISDIYRFASAATGSSLVFLTYRNIDYAILGAQASPAQVGLYWRAYQLGVSYQGKISRVMLRVSLPIYSRATSLEELQRLRVRIVRTHATVLLPLLGTFIGVAPVLVPWLFGSAWEPAVVPAQIMAVAGMADAVTTGVGPLMIALGRPRALLIWNVVQLVAFTAIVLVLAPRGTTTLATGVAVFGVFNAFAIQFGLLRPYAGLPLRQLVADTSAGVAAALAAIAATVSARELLEGSLPDIAVLAILGAVALLAVAVVLRVAFPEQANDVLRILGRGRRRPRPVDEDTAIGVNRLE